MKRKPAGSSGFLGPLCFLMLLLFPAVLRVLESQSAPRRTRDILEGTRGALDSAQLLDSLRIVREELERITKFDYDRQSFEERGLRYEAVLGLVLPFGDPSPLRRSLWISFDRNRDLPADSAVASGYALVGRLEKVPLVTGIARVQILGDPGFRVKFRCGETVGVLRGTSRRTAEGEALLEAHHVTPLGGLPADAPVLTAGRDGVYPSGILIGWAVGREERSGAFPLVRAAVSPEGLNAVVVLVDRARRELTKARGSSP